MSYQALLFCPDEKTARVVTQILSELDFLVEPSNEPFGAVKRLMAQHFDAVVVDCDNEQNAALLFKSARNSAANQSSLAVAVVEGQAGVAKAFRIGANLVLTKPINVEQAKGTLRVARGLLRKGDVAKSAPASQATIPVPIANPETKRSATPTPLPSIAATPAPMAPPPVQAQAPSGFELAVEDGPRPEAAEAALIETMTDSLPSDSRLDTPKPTKQFPWQPVAKPNAEPMASALRKAADVAGKTETHEAAKLLVAPSETLAKSKVRPINAVTPSSKGPGTATAPAFQPSLASDSNVTSIAQQIPTDEENAVPKIETHAQESQHVHDVAPLTFSSFAEENKSAGGGGKKLLLIAVVLLAVFGAVYYVWTNMHSATPVQTQPAPAPAPQPVVPSAVDRVPSAVHETSVTEPKAVAPAGANSPAPKATVPAPVETNPVSTPVAIEPKPVAAGNAPQPIVVKNGTSVSSGSPVVEDVEAPSASAVTGSSGSARMISGIVGSAPAAMPVASRQTLKISQGVSEGLILKKVQPVYPQQALQMRVQGSVQLLASVGKDGTIGKVKTVSGDSILARAATDAVKQWKYRPYLLNGEPVEIQTQITMVFKLP